MKKLVVLLLLALLVFCFVSCDLAEPGNKVDDGPFAGTIYIRRMDNKALLGQTYGLPSHYTKWSQMSSSDWAFSSFTIPDKGTYDFFDFNGSELKISGESMPMPPALTVCDAQGNPITDKESLILKNVYVSIN